MLFPYHFDSPLTPSAVKIQRENLKELERQHFADYSIFELIANRTQFCDDLLKQLWQQFELDKAHLTLIAEAGTEDKKCFLYLIWMFLFFQKKKESLKQKRKLVN